MRRQIDDPRTIPALGPAIQAAEEAQCIVGTGYTMGTTIVGLWLTASTGQQLTVEFHQQSWRNGGRLVKKRLAALAAG